LAGLGTVSSVDVHSVCLIPSSLPTMTSFGTYKTIYMDRVDLVLMKSGKKYEFLNFNGLFLIFLKLDFVFPPSFIDYILTSVIT
jgi:hypothetical protein